jgi:hypothetical protein
MIYANGVLAASTNAPSGSVSGTNTTYIGRSALSVLAHLGWLDEVRVYNRALTAAEVKQLYRMGAIPKGIK